MSGWGASFVLMYSGQLSLDEKYSPTYVGGSYRPLQVSANTNLEQLKIRILKFLKYGTSKYSVNLVCRLPLGNEFIASAVDDDEVCQMVLSHAGGQILILYVDVKEITTRNIAVDQLTSHMHEIYTFDGVTECSPTNPSFVQQYAE
ncbi:hypothetical protein MA16_Dca022215 [Dendrobium catenatum]|uniref:PB1 domain-containing protein n=1 Tax=Dendrobium catenatum TaxID=906689 RepID=A0A2I0W7T6_9ASPA|nr:hypothetical protein MA16_Dca022215 [Dendrobium catenatum]